MKFRPCIDLHEGKVKQIVGETLTSDKPKENFVSEKDASYFATLYRENNLSGGHIVMLGQGNKAEALNALNTFPGGMQVGGGINDSNYKEYLDNGASHIIVTSYIFEQGQVNLDKVKNISSKTGAGNLVIDLSCKLYNNTYYVVSNKWKDITDFELTRENLGKLSKYCDEFLIHAAHIEGKRQGADFKLIKLLAEFSDIPVTYAGGINSQDEIKEVKSSGNDKIDITIGSALDIFGGDLNFNKIIKMDVFK